MGAIVDEGDDGGNDGGIDENNDESNDEIRHKVAIGLMSGTSADGVDAALIETDGERVFATGPYEFVEYSTDERALILSMMQKALAANSKAARDALGAELSPLITERHAVAVERLMTKAGLQAGEVDVVGFHGQTLIHAPLNHAPEMNEADGVAGEVEGYTLQAGDGEALAKKLSIPVVYDFRSHDVTNGGQGAPLVPVYHQALVRASKLDLPVAVVNIGGVSNVSYVGKENALMAFDTGPGNVLIDEWIAKKTGARMDEGGALAADGVIDMAVVDGLLKNEYFNIAPPKSLDRYHFSSAAIETFSVQDGAATLVEFTVRSIAAASRFMDEAPKCWVIVGGGGRNDYLMQRLRDVIEAPVLNALDLDWEGGYVEAEAFGFLAVRHLYGLPLTYPLTTGVSQPLMGGKLAKV